MANDDQLSLQEAFKEAFKNSAKFISNNILIGDCNCLLRLTEDEIIDDACRKIIINCASDDEKRLKIVEHLLAKNEIAIYRKFIDVCDAVAPKVESYIIQAVNEQVKKVGLSESYNYCKSKQATSATTTSEVKPTQVYCIRKVFTIGMNGYCRA